MNKFDDFLTKFAKASGASELCESVREAAKVCFEGLENKPIWMKQSTLNDTHKNNEIPTYRDIHRMMFHDIPREKAKKIMAAKKALAADTDVQVDEDEQTK
jgi:hypothetical protein